MLKVVVLFFIVDLFRSSPENHTIYSYIKREEWPDYNAGEERVV